MLGSYMEPFIISPICKKNLVLKVVVHMAGCERRNGGGVIVFGLNGGDWVVGEMGKENEIEC